MNRVNILNVQLDLIRHQEIEQKLEKLFEKNSRVLICTPNPEIIIAANKNHYLQQLLNKRSSLNLVDGYGLLWAGRFLTLNYPEIVVVDKLAIFLQWLVTIILIPILPPFFRTPIPERIAGADFIWILTKFAAKKRLKVFLLGGGPTVVERCALELQTKIPELRVAGVYSGSASDTENIIKAINKSRANILIVAFGAPKQEIWLDKNLSKTCCKIGVGLGGTFDFIAGTQKRAPAWMQKYGLEWFYRLMCDPSRISRQLAIPKFMWLVLIEKLSKSKQLPKDKHD